MHGMVCIGMGMIWYTIALYGMVYHSCYACYGMHCLVIVWYALEMVWYGMVCIGMVWYALEMICKGNGNGMHWKLYALALVWHGMAYHTIAFYGTVCKGDDNGMHCLTIVWYAFPCHCMLCIGNGMHWYGMVWHTIPFLCIVWYTNRVMHGMLCIALPLYGMHWQWYGMVCIVWYGMHSYGMVWYGMQMQWQWYALAMVWYGMAWYAFICKGYGMQRQWQWYALSCHCIIFIGNGMH
jgi:hypothetical protein